MKKRCRRCKLSKHIDAYAPKEWTHRGGFCRDCRRAFNQEHKARYAQENAGNLSRYKNP